MALEGLYPGVGAQLDLRGRAEEQVAKLTNEISRIISKGWRTPSPDPKSPPFARCLRLLEVLERFWRKSRAGRGSSAISQEVVAGDRAGTLGSGGDRAITARRLSKHCYRAIGIPALE